MISNIFYTFPKNTQINSGDRKTKMAPVSGEDQDIEYVLILSYQHYVTLNRHCVGSRAHLTACITFHELPPQN